MRLKRKIPARRYLRSFHGRSFGLWALRNAKDFSRPKGGRKRIPCDKGMEVDRHKLCPMRLEHRCVTVTVGAGYAVREGWQVRWLVCPWPRTC